MKVNRDDVSRPLSEKADGVLIHIAIFSGSIFALVCAVSSIDATSMAERLRRPELARWIGGLLTLVGVGQGGLWVFVILRYVATGEVLADIPVRGQHLVFALDLSLLVPTLVVAGVLLWRRTPMGYVAAPIVSVTGSLVLLNLLLAAAFQANADVAGVKAFPPEGVAMTVGMIASAVLLLGRSTKKDGRERTMRLTWRDGVATVLVACAGAVTLAVTEGSWWGSSQGPRRSSWRSRPTSASCGSSRRRGTRSVGLIGDLRRESHDRRRVHRSRSLDPARPGDAVAAGLPVRTARAGRVVALPAPRARVSSGVRRPEGAWFP